MTRSIKTVAVFAELLTSCAYATAAGAERTRYGMNYAMREM
jgi:hypothetical protein